MRWAINFYFSSSGHASLYNRANFVGFLFFVEILKCIFFDFFMKVASASKSWVPPSPCPLKRKEPLKVFFEATDDEEDEDADEDGIESGLDSSFDHGDNNVYVSSNSQTCDEAARCLQAAARRYSRGEPFASVSFADSISSRSRGSVDNDHCGEAALVVLLQHELQTFGVKKETGTATSGENFDSVTTRPAPEELKHAEEGAMVRTTLKHARNSNSSMYTDSESVATDKESVTDSWDKTEGSSPTNVSSITATSYSRKDERGRHSLN